MKNIKYPIFLALLAAMSLCVNLFAQDTRLPNGRQLSPIVDGVYPQDYFLNTEKLGSTEMCIVALGTGMYQATYITSYVHTPPQAFGKIMSVVKPRLAVGYHIWPNPE